MIRARIGGQPVMRPPSPIRIRPVQARDAAGVSRALSAVASERRFLAVTTGFDLRATVDFVRCNLAQGNPHYVVVTGPDDDVVGWCDIVPALPWEGFRHVGRLGMGLLPGWRGHGIGRELLAAAMGDCAARGFLRVELEVFASNTRAIRLYEGAGFLHEGRSVAACQIDGRWEDIVRMAQLMGALVQPACHRGSSQR